MDKVKANIIQGLWIGPELSLIEQLSIKSFLANGHEYHLYVYDDVKNIPPGTTIIDGNTIVDAKYIFQQQTGWGKGSYANFADYFRYNLLITKGNWWMDTDMVCLRPIDLDKDTIICTSFEGEWGVIPNVNVLKFSPGDPFIKKCLDYCHSIDLNTVNYGQIGPHLIQRMVKELNYEPYLAPYHYFNPIFWRCMDRHIYKKFDIKQRLKEALRPLLKPDSMIGNRVQPDSYTIHLWNEVWKNNNWQKNERFHSSSLIEKLKKKYL